MCVCVYTYIFKKVPYTYVWVCYMTRTMHIMRHNSSVTLYGGTRFQGKNMYAYSYPYISVCVGVRVHVSHARRTSSCTTMYIQLCVCIHKIREVRIQTDKQNPKKHE